MEIQDEGDEGTGWAQDVQETRTLEEFLAAIQKENEIRKLKTGNRAWLVMMCEKRKDTGEMDRSTFRAIKQMILEKERMRARMSNDNDREDMIAWESSDGYNKELDGKLTRLFELNEVVGDVEAMSNDDGKEDWNGISTNILVSISTKERDLIRKYVKIQKKKIEESNKRRGINR